MEQATEQRERIQAAVRVDKLFPGFEIELTPAEAMLFATLSSGEAPTPAAFSTLIHQLNAGIPPADFGPEHKQTGKAHHSYRIGRERGRRVLKLEIFKGFFQVDYDFMALLESIHSVGLSAGAEVQVNAGNNSYTVAMRWGWQKP